MKYKLTYFNWKCLGEPIRLLLTYLGLEFEDVRLEKEGWPLLKSRYPFEKLPLLEFDGIKATQSMAICRYLAREYNLNGANNLESLNIDMFMETVNDLRGEAAKLLTEEDKEVKESIRTKLLEKTVPFYMSRFDEIIKDNKGYVANRYLSWADIFFASFLDTMNGLLEADLTEEYPNCFGVMKKVFNLPKIKEYIASRPELDF